MLSVEDGGVDVELEEVRARRDNGEECEGRGRGSSRMIHTLQFSACCASDLARERKKIAFAVVFSSSLSPLALSHATPRLQSGPQPHSLLSTPPSLPRNRTYFSPNPPSFRHRSSLLSRQTPPPAYRRTATSPHSGWKHPTKPTVAPPTPYTARPLQAMRQPRAVSLRLCDLAS